MIIDRPTAFVTFEFQGPGQPLLVNFKLNGVPEIKVLRAMEWAAKFLATDIFNRAVIACKTNDIETVVEYLRTQQTLEDQEIDDILNKL